ncbi:MAG: hypothetical protein IKS87_02065 [Lachnospiraceae bacterium]|nr:hypothetical protein [Lachnospiraceae bacterium]
MKIKSFAEVAGERANPFLFIINRFSGLADLPLAEYFRGLEELFAALIGCSALKEDATVYDAAEAIRNSFTPTGDEEHVYGEEDLRAARMILYLAAAAAKQTAERSNFILAGIDRCVKQDLLYDFASVYTTGKRLSPEDNRYVYLLDASGCGYPQLFAALVRILDGAPNTGWGLKDLPKLDSPDIFLMTGLPSLLDSLYLSLVIPLIASKDKAFEKKAKNMVL